MEFEEKGVAAIPVCVVRHDAPNGFLPREISFVDRGSKLYSLKSTGREAGTPETAIDVGELKNLFEEIEKIFPDGDGEALSALKEAFAPDTDLVSSCARWLKYLLNDFGVIVIERGATESRCLQQGRTLPAAVFVADSMEIEECVKALSQREGDGVIRPIIRRCPDATISNARNLKTLKRYGLDFERLFDGKERVMEYVREMLKSDVPVRLQKLREETGAVLDEL
ncbi:MAG: hypothetical protein LBJ21_00895, partial [Acidobacteriota bacterium]|nr:hypothetical protein [Acidobacteriota bacterium]